MTSSLQTRRVLAVELLEQRNLLSTNAPALSEPIAPPQPAAIVQYPLSNPAPTNGVSLSGASTAHTAGNFNVNAEAIANVFADPNFDPTSRESQGYDHGYDAFFEDHSCIDFHGAQVSASTPLQSLSELPDWANEIAADLAKLHAGRQPADLITAAVKTNDLGTGAEISAVSLLDAELDNQVLIRDPVHSGEQPIGAEEYLDSFPREGFLAPTSSIHPQDWKQILDVTKLETVDQNGERIVALSGDAIINEGEAPQPFCLAVRDLDHPIAQEPSETPSGEPSVPENPDHAGQPPFDFLNETTRTSEPIYDFEDLPEPAQDLAEQYANETPDSNPEQFVHQAVEVIDPLTNTEITVLTLDDPEGVRQAYIDVQDDVFMSLEEFFDRYDYDDFKEPNTATVRVHPQAWEKITAVDQVSVTDLDGVRAYTITGFAIMESGLQPEQFCIALEDTPTPIEPPHEEKCFCENLEGAVHAHELTLEELPEDVRDHILGVVNGGALIKIQEASGLLLFSFADVNGEVNVGILDLLDQFTFGDGSVPLAEFLKQAYQKGDLEFNPNKEFNLDALERVTNILDFAVTQEGEYRVLHLQADGVVNDGCNLVCQEICLKARVLTPKEEPPKEVCLPCLENGHDKFEVLYTKDTEFGQDITEWADLPQWAKDIAARTASYFPGDDLMNFVSGGLRTKDMVVTSILVVDESRPQEPGQPPHLKLETFIQILDSQPQTLKSYLQSLLENENPNLMAQFFGEDRPQDFKSLDQTVRITFTRIDKDTIRLTFAGFGQKFGNDGHGHEEQLHGDKHAGDKDHGDKHHDKEKKLDPFCFGVEIRTKVPPYLPPIPPTPPLIPNQPFYYYPPITTQYWYPNSSSYTFLGGGGGGGCTCCEATERVIRFGAEDLRFAVAQTHTPITPENLGDQEPSLSGDPDDQTAIKKKKHRRLSLEDPLEQLLEEPSLLSIEDNGELLKSKKDKHQETQRAEEPKEQNSGAAERAPEKKEEHKSSENGAASPRQTEGSRALREEGFMNLAFAWFAKDQDSEAVVADIKADSKSMPVQVDTVPASVTLEQLSNRGNPARPAAARPPKAEVAAVKA